MLIFVLLFFISICQIKSQSLNEIMSSNSSIIQDEDGDYSDWLEIYNPSDSAINLVNFALSDDIGNVRKWIFPNIVIEPNSYIIVFASDKNKTTAELHTNFKISAAGEHIILTDNNFQIVDHLEPTPISANISLGRSLSDASQWHFFTDPTPGRANSDKGFKAISENPVFSTKGGFYHNSVNLELSTISSNHNVYFTLDGSEPTKESIKYTAPITIDSTLVIRARVFADSLLPSKIISHSYFINENTSLPVVSLSTNPDNFWDDKIGIYVVGTNGIKGQCDDEIANYNQEWERPVHVEFFESNKNLAFSIDAGISIHGGCTRRLPQKSLQITARSKYGNKSILYKIFPNLPFNEYTSILLRSSGNDSYSTMIRDAMVQGLVENLDIETQAYRPAVVFLNGKYFGIHNIRERHNKDYIFQHHIMKNIDIDLLYHTNYVKEGSNEHYNNLYEYITNNDLSVLENYEIVEQQIEIENYIIYMLSEMYIVNRDWYPGNTKFWRPRTEDGKWRWIIYDTDYGFGISDIETINNNTINYVKNPSRYPSVVFNGLLENESFTKKFINAFSDLTNTVFKPNTVIARIDSYYAMIDGEMPRHISKWKTISSYINWLSNINDLRYFANNRIPIMQNHFREEFNLGPIKDVYVNINNTEFGSIRINSIHINKFPWKGQYFEGNEITIEAIPKPGHKFVRWIGNNESEEKTIFYMPSDSSNIIAVFEVDSQSYPVVINEINYNSLESSQDIYSRSDWIELYNNSVTSFNLGGWKFNDENNSFTFPNNSILSGGEYLVIADSLHNFQYYYPQVQNVLTQGFEFGLSGNGEKLKLYNATGLLIDSVKYSDDPPWPTKPDGNGNTLELVNPNWDNVIPINWKSSRIINGTPGNKNSVFYNEYICDLQISSILSSKDKIKISWNKCEEECLDFYAVYRFQNPNFTADSVDSYFHSTRDTVFIDTNVVLNHIYYYQIAAFDTNGFRSSFSEKAYAILTQIANKKLMPTKFALSQNYPNPFNPSTKIKFGIPKRSKVSLVVYNVLGQEVSQLINQQLNAGYYEVGVNISNYSSGIYYYRIQTSGYSETKKMILMK